ncbi:MAG: toll/interleukin-1 receptor domain-containing protein [Anaerolineales bacterium]
MAKTTNRQLKAFLCHTSTDKLAVQSLYQQLLADGIDAWLDQEKLLPGQKWQDEIPKAIKSSDIVIVCLSKNSTNKDGYIQKEIKYALDIAEEKAEGSIYIIPARLEECDVPERFSKYQWVNLFEKTGYKKLFRALIAQGEQIKIIHYHNQDEILGKTSTQYRQEILKPFFKYIKNGESFYIIGAPSVGKTKLIDFIMGDDPYTLWAGGDNEETDSDWVKRKYLGEDIGSKTWLVRVDINRMTNENKWSFHFYELLLNTLLLTCNRYSFMERIESLKVDLAALDSQVIQSKDALMAQRLFEMAVNMICQSYNIQICFLFDEFDATYLTMPREVFSQLRAIRDSNKYHLAYILLLRNLPENLRDPSENEGFYELISRNMLGLGPYSALDAFHIIGQLEKRRDYELTKEIREWLWKISGGHPGLIHALFTLIRETEPSTSQIQNIEWVANQEIVRKEFRKIWSGLLEEERDGLTKISQGSQAYVSPTTGKLLLAKGIIKPATKYSVTFFTPLFDYWLKSSLIEN